MMNHSISSRIFFSFRQSLLPVGFFWIAQRPQMADSRSGGLNVSRQFSQIHPLLVIIRRIWTGVVAARWAPHGQVDWGKDLG